MDHNIGGNHTEQLLDWLKLIDISEINFIGITINNECITRKTLIDAKIKGAEHAIVQVGDLTKLKLKDPQRQHALKTRIRARLKIKLKALEWSFKPFEPSSAAKPIQSSFIITITEPATSTIKQIKLDHCLSVTYKTGFTCKFNFNKIDRFCQEYKDQLPPSVLKRIKDYYELESSFYKTNRPILQTEIDKMYEKIYRLIMAKKQESIKNGKPLLIIAGENHYKNKALLLEALIFEIMRQIQIKKIWFELYPDDLTLLNSNIKDSRSTNMFLFLTEYYEMKRCFLEEKEERNLLPSTYDRNLRDTSPIFHRILREIVMVEHLLKEHQTRNAHLDSKDSKGGTVLEVNDNDGFVITGRAHLQSLIESSKALGFEVLAFNVGGYEYSLNGNWFYSVDEKIEQYSTDPKHVVQLKFEGAVNTYFNTELLQLARQATENFNKRRAQTVINELAAKREMPPVVAVEPLDVEGIKELSLAPRILELMTLPQHFKNFNTFYPQSPRLLKQGDQYYCYGTPDGINWKVTHLDGTVCAKFAARFSTDFVKYSDDTKELFADIARQGAHLPFKDLALTTALQKAPKGYGASFPANSAAASAAPANTVTGTVTPDTKNDAKNTCRLY